MNELMNDLDGMGNIDALAEIKESIKELVEYAFDRVSDSEKERAKGYWYASIMMALDDEHDFMGGSGGTMQSTIDAMDEK